MNFLALIEAKRDGKLLDAPQSEPIVSAYTAGQIADYQMAAFLM
ncbi:MAG: thymidine phosphorylase, partial [Verrucomicrobiota bacterium]